MRKSLKSASQALFVAAMAVFVATTAHSCKNSGDTAPIATHTVDTTFNAADSTTSVTIKADYPAADAGGIAADSIREYINGVLKGSFIYTDENGNPRKKNPLYGGDIKNGEAVAVFYGKAFLGDLYEMRKQVEDFSQAGYAQDINMHKASDTSTFVTYESSVYQFLGGAHGLTFFKGATISKLDGHRLGCVVDTALVAKMQSLLTRGLTQYFQGLEQLENGEIRLSDFLFTESNAIPLPQCSPYLTKEGVKFVYQQYEIAPYAMGMPEFTIPYKEIMTFLTDEALDLVVRLHENQ